jgi:hypothetical protein
MDARNTSQSAAGQTREQTLRIDYMKKTALLVAAMMGLAVASALAQQRPPQGGGQPGAPTGQENDRPGRGGPRGGTGSTLMGALDTNGNGTLEANEIQSAPMSLRKLDANKDFKLTPDELGSRGGGNMSERMMEMDKNKDGKLSSDEVPERMQRFIERMDTNGDGAVDKAEMEAFQKEMQERFQDGRGGDRGGDRGGPGRGGPSED